MNFVKAQLTWKYEILERLYTYASSTRIHKKDVGRLEGCLAARSPQSELSIIFLLLLCWAVEYRGSLTCYDLSHFHRY